MRPLISSLAALALVAIGAPSIYAQALHAPRNDLGVIVRITPPTGCAGALAGDTSLLSGNNRYQAYVCRNAGASSFFVSDNGRRKNIPMFGLPAGFAEPKVISEKGNFVVIFSDTAIPPGSESVKGAWALYLFSRRTQGTTKILEDDPAMFGDVLGDNLCPAADMTAFGQPQVIAVDNRGRTLVRFDARTTSGGTCPGGLYLELVP
jgi:hypothetical protein